MFVDTGAFIPIIVAGGDPEHDQLASALLAAFDQRIKGQRNWGEWTTRRTWADVHLQARMGHFGRARTLARRAYVRLLADGLAREAAAAALDLGQLLCRRGLPSARDWRAAVDVTDRCVKRRPDLAPLHREGFAEILKVLEDYPESAFDQMVALRRSFIAPVPGVMAERMGAP